MSLFIGLGGVGTGVLDSLYDKMKTYNNNLQAQNKPQVSADYYYIDTENKRYANSPNEFGAGSNKKFLQIGLNSPDTIVDSFRRSAQTNAAVKKLYDLMQKWYDAPSKTTSMLDGADTVRQYSRLAFCDAIVNTTFYNDLTQLITNVYTTGGRVYVITGSCGGTGCGIYMDLLYAISKIFEDLTTATQTTNVRFIMAMPEGYVNDGSQVDVQRDKKMLNAYATLAELNEICKGKNDPTPKFNGCYIGLQNKKKKGVFQPFRHGYMYDSAGLSRDDVSQQLSDFLFELELAGDTTNGTSTLNGYTGSEFDALLTGTVDANWNASINYPYVQAFNALGQYSIEKPDFLYRKYFQDRLLYDVFHEGLIGTGHSVSANEIDRVVNGFKEHCDNLVQNATQHISSRIVSTSDFKDKATADITFTVFTQYPNTNDGSDGIVCKILAQKNTMLGEIETYVYKECKEWLYRYDFSTVYKILDQIDIDNYDGAKTTHKGNTIDNQLATAKESIKAKWYQKGDIDVTKAKEQFDGLLKIWLTYEVNKALSSGIDTDISIDNQGYLDKCKEFVEMAKRGFVLDNEQEHWDATFIKTVTDLKKKEDRSYIPDLNTIVDDQNRIPEPDNCPMVSVYENSFKAANLVSDISQGKCTPVELHQEIIKAMKNNSGVLEQEGVNLNQLFDPTPGSGNSFRGTNKTNLFKEKYITYAKEQINILLQRNQAYEDLFKDNIIARLKGLPAAEKTNKCFNFRNFDKVQLRIQNGVQVVATKYKYYILSDTSETQLMQDLGILDNSGKKSSNTDHTPHNEFFADKIVKLIVQNGYSIDNYRYFEDYKENAEARMISSETHDPFIDTRFRGKLSASDKYPCDVKAALGEIAAEEQAAVQADVAAERAREFSLDGCNDVQVYQFCLVLLAKYYETLQTNNDIENDLKNAINLSNRSITIKSLKFNKFLQTYKLDSQVPDPVNLESIKDTNSMLDLRIWIDFVSKKKNLIRNEKVLYDTAYSMLLDFVDIEGSALETVVMLMRGTDNKPVYDFFNAFLDWYNNKKN